MIQLHMSHCRPGLGSFLPLGCSACCTNTWNTSTLTPRTPTQLSPSIQEATQETPGSGTWRLCMHHACTQSKKSPSTE
ncbi:hypothetical protein SKAU_G00326810 [Synaphobranchus kaupii]|uniref:Uncharacterized protein n=1 Tax=Synaphobranchus kaupii TaxID=118154 RepID=A0A9Q1EPZ5_SYNKA|nr:hypothetical protein SKAU_G00326810 [Synaphobranchus kaupii]